MCCSYMSIATSSLYKYANTILSMCAHMCYKSGMFGGGTTPVKCDPCPYYTLYWGHKLMQLVSSAEVDIIGEQQLMQMQSGSSSCEEDTIGEQQLWRGHNWGAAAVKRTQLGSSSWCRCSWGTAAEVDTIGEQQLKRTQLGSSSSSGHSWGAAAEVDTTGEQQLKTVKLLVTTTFMIHAHKIHAWEGRTDQIVPFIMILFDW